MNKLELAEELGIVFGQMEKILQGVRHSHNVIEVTEAYKKMKELGLWVTLALQVNQPTQSTTLTVPRKKVEFAQSKEPVVANT